MSEINETNKTAGPAFVDPLLECLIIIAKQHGRPQSPDALRAGLPLVNHHFTPELLIRAAARAGFSAHVIKRSLKKISNLTLPAILILQHSHACILHHLHEDGTADVIFPENPEGTVRKPLAELAEEFSGYIIFIKPLANFERQTEAPVNEAGSWFFGTLWRYRYIYTQVALAALFVNIFTLVGPLFVMAVYDRVIPNYAETTLWVLAIGIVIIYCFDFLLRMIRAYLIDISGKKADIIMSSTIFQHVLGMQLINKPASVGAFANNLREFETLRDFFTSATLTTLIDIPFSILFLFLIWYLGGYLVWVPLLAIPVVLISAFAMEKPLNESVKQSMQGMAYKNAILIETIAGLETIKSLGAEGQMQRKWEQNVANVAGHGLKSRFYSSLIGSISNYSQQMILVFTVVLGVYLIHANELTIGGLIACNILANRVLAPLAQTTNLLTRYAQAKLALQSLNKIMSASLERPAKKHFTHRPALEGHIEFDNVTFHYPQQKKPCLDKVSFQIKPGERVGFIGRIGSGKTTIQKLILGFYPPTSGHIRIDGIDISQIDPADLRRNIAYVPQDSLLFFGNVRDNIAMGVPWAEDEDIIEVAHLAGVDAFTNLHPHGFDLQVGERGEGLSGGQRQAVAIARAILGKAPVCLFDEPTSAMDNATERDLILRLATYLPHKTLLLVTHKVSLFPLVQRLILLDNGKLLLDGPRDQILAQLAQPTQAASNKPSGTPTNPS